METLTNTWLAGLKKSPTELGSESFKDLTPVHYEGLSGGYNLEVRLSQSNKRRFQITKAGEGRGKSEGITWVLFAAVMTAERVTCDFQHWACLGSTRDWKVMDGSWDTGRWNHMWFLQGRELGRGKSEAEEPKWGWMLYRWGALCLLIRGYIKTGAPIKRAWEALVRPWHRQV